MHRTITAGTLILAIAVIASACGRQPDPEAAARARQDELCRQRLATFDTLDFTVFSHQAWSRLGESHDSNIVVTWPDGHETTGIRKHVEDLGAMFVYAPNTNIAEHPVRTCTGDYTAVTGLMTGTFSAPMPIGNGRTIPPTGKSFRLLMATVAHWRGTTMDHEWLFWDNQAFMQQVGLAH
jgi:SnoaL-like polyketide cyclase